LLFQAESSLLAFCLIPFQLK